jgi:Tfp pilus tip-associated adhesin PilY1
MEKIKYYNLIVIFTIFGLIFTTYPGFADDTCVFSVTADDIPPNITILLDSGAEMEQIVWHSGYDNSIDYTPSVTPEVDVVEPGGASPDSGTLTLINVTNSNFSPGYIMAAISGAKADVLSFDMTDLSYENLLGGPFQVGEIVEETTRALVDRGAGEIASITESGGFYNDNGYSILKSGIDYILVEVPSDLDPLTHSYELTADTSDTSNKWGEWTINGRTIRLPAEPSSSVDTDGIKDNATYFRYSKNYLNWLFFATGAGSYSTESAVDDGTDLPDVTRFYYAKKAIMTVAKGTGYQAKFGLYYFATTTGGSQAQPLKFAVQAESDGVDNDGDGDTDEFDEILTSAFINNINNMSTVTYSPLAEGLSTIGYYYSSPSSGASGGYCQNNFALVISPGVSSEDQAPKPQYVPGSLSDYDGDNAAGVIIEGEIMEDNTNDGVDNDGDSTTDEADEAVTYAIPINQNGSTYLDDVAYYLYANDIVGDAPSTGSLCYDGLTGAFSVGETVTGGTSGATGAVAAVNADAGIPSTSGCLELDTISGTFQDNEALTSGAGGAATVNGRLFESGEGYQNVLTYTIGFMGDQEGNLFLINTSNNGNGNKNLYDTSDEEYGKYHFVAESPENLSEQLLAAVNNILSKTSSFTAPVVPVTRTTSGDKIYMAFFKPGEGNFWEGNVTKFGISADNQIIDANGNPATWPNGAMKDDAVPYWATIDWADNLPNSSRNIYTYLGTSVNLTNANNEFVDTNTDLTAATLGSPTNSIADIINYVRGADVFDEDEDGDTTDNRAVITGDVLHSEPSIFQYDYADGSSKTMVYFGANDGTLHAVLDITVGAGGSPETLYGTEAWAFIPPDQLHRLKEMVEGVDHEHYVDSTPKIFFKDVDNDGVIDTIDGDKVILVCGERKGGTSYFALDVTDPSDPQYLWRVGQYYDNRYGTIALTNMTGTWQDVLWIDHINTDDPATGSWDGYVTQDSSTVSSVQRYIFKAGGHELAAGDKVFAYKVNAYDDGDTATVDYISEDAPYSAGPTTVISELGETWSEPQFGLVKTATGVDTHVLFVGGGYSSDNSKGKTVLAINVEDGTLVKQFATGMSSPFPSSVSAIDEDGNGYVDKLYVGDLGGQMWRFSNFIDITNGSTLTFPDCNEIINHAGYPWTGQVFFKTDDNNSRKFFYPPSVTLEKGYDLVFMGTGDRENACCNTTTVACSSSEPDILCAVKDTHSSSTIIGEEDIAGTLYPKELVDVTDPADTPPDLSDPTSNVDGGNGASYLDKGWYIRLVDDSGNAVGEKALETGTVFYKNFYITTFTPNDEPCVPGGEGKLYALSYLTGGAAIDFDDDGSNDRSLTIGGGIPSKPVMIIRDSGTQLLISVGSTNPDADSEDVGAGVLNIDPVVPEINFFYLWWRELFD